MMNLNFPNITLKKKVFCCKYKTFQVSLSVRESFCLRLFRSTNCFFSCSCAAAGGRASFFFSSSFVFFICPYFPPFFYSFSLFLCFSPLQAAAAASTSALAPGTGAPHAASTFHSSPSVNEGTTKEKHPSFFFLSLSFLTLLFFSQ